MSLLSYLYPRIKGSQEDVATLALTYILNQNQAMASHFTDMICDALDLSPLQENIIYRAQHVGDDLERPDVTGFDRDGKIIFLCENKFYAGLTPNQPNGYLDEIRNHNGLGLLFICPANRQISLYRQLVSLCPGSFEKDSTHFLTPDEIPVGILTWGSVLSALRTCAQGNAQDLLPDIEQLIDFCNLIDSNQYPVFRPEDYDADVSKKIERYQVVIDLMVDKMIADISRKASTSGLRAAPSKGGYIRYLSSNGLAFTLQFSRWLWRKPGVIDTPYWFGCKREWNTSNRELMSKVVVPDFQRSDEGDIMIGLIPKPYLTVDETASDLIQQIDELILPLIDSIQL